MDLINLGWYGRAPLKDQVTPYKVALLVLVEEYLTGNSEEKTEFILAGKEERDFLIGLLHLVQVLHTCTMFVNMIKYAMQ